MRTLLVIVSAVLIGVCQAQTRKTLRQAANPCRELADSISAENITAYDEKRLAHYNTEVLNPDSLTNPENVDNARKCVLFPRVAPAEREAALNILGAILTHKAKMDAAQEQRDKDTNNSYLLKCADDMDKYKTVVLREPGKLMMEAQMATDLKEAKRQCWASISVGMTETRKRAFDALFGTQEVVSTAYLDGIDKTNKGWADAYLSTISKYNQLVNDYNALLDRSQNLANLAYQISHRPVFLWTPPAPPKEIHCNTSGTINTYGSTTINANTHCTEY
jgi:hypothetical protein